MSEMVKGKAILLGMAMGPQHYPWQWGKTRPKVVRVKSPKVIVKGTVDNFIADVKIRHGLALARKPFILREGDYWELSGLGTTYSLHSDWPSPNPLSKNTSGILSVPEPVEEDDLTIEWLALAYGLGGEETFRKDYAMIEELIKNDRYEF